jgi:hypothetical protein
MSEKKSFVSRVVEKVKGKGRKKDRHPPGGSPSGSQRVSSENAPVPPSEERVYDSPGATVNSANIPVETKVDVASTLQRTEETAVDMPSRKRTPKPTIATPSKGKRAREAAILWLDFGSIISEATDVLKPMKMVCQFVKKVLEVAKVSISILIWPPSGLMTISLFTKTL